MSKAKSIFITVLLSLAIFAAAFFAVFSCSYAGGVKRMNSIASNIQLGAEYSGYAYTTIFPEGVLTEEEYTRETAEDKATKFTKVGNLYVDGEIYEDVNQLKSKVNSDAKKLNARFGEKSYSSYSVAVEDGLTIKVSVPTGFTYAQYKHPDVTEKDSTNSRTNKLNAAKSAIANLVAYGNFTLRTSESTISGKNYEYEGKDEWVDKAVATDQSSGSTYDKTYSFTGSDDAATYIKSVTYRKVGKYAAIKFNFTDKGATKFKEISTYAAAATTDHNIYFFVGSTQILQYNCTTVHSGKTLELQTTDYTMVENAAIAINSAANCGNLELNYKELGAVNTTVATNGDNAALLMFIACIVVFLGLAVLLTVKYKKLGVVTSVVAFMLALVELYALMLLKIQVTFAVILSSMICLALYAVCNVLVFAEVKRLTSGGRTIQAAIKDAYKRNLMTVTDMHLVLLVVTILLTTVAKGTVAACGFIALIGVIASYVLYWFNRFMWYVISSPVKDKFKFAGLKRVVYEDD